MIGPEIRPELLGAQAFHLAESLTKAVDRVVLLEQCERVTGRAWLTQADIDCLKLARGRWVGFKEQQRWPSW